VFSTENGLVFSTVHSISCFANLGGGELWARVPSPGFVRSQLCSVTNFLCEFHIFEVFHDCGSGDHPLAYWLLAVVTHSTPVLYILAGCTFSPLPSQSGLPDPGKHCTHRVRGRTMQWLLLHEARRFFCQSFLPVDATPPPQMALTSVFFSVLRMSIEWHPMSPTAEAVTGSGGNVPG